MFLRQKKIVLLFFLILLIGFIVRVWDLGKNPAGFFCDEASIGYNAYSILKTGKDEYGKPFPIFFQAFGEYKNPLDIYSTIPFVALFGLNEFSVRMNSVFFSVLGIVVIYFIGKTIKDTTLGLIFSALLAISPWSIHMARINMEGFSHFVFFVLCSLWMLSLYIRKNKPIYIILFSVCSGIVVYTYFPARIIVPIYFLITLIILFIKSNRKLLLYSFLVFGVILLPLAYHMFFGGGLERWNNVNLFNDRNVTSPLSKIKLSYLLHFSPDFLLFKGDIDTYGQYIKRHSVRGIGQIYFWQAPFIFLGIWYVFKKRMKLGYSILVLLLLFPIPSSLTSDVSPIATRSVIGIVPLTMLTGFGLWMYFSWLKRIKKTVIKIIFVFFMGAVIIISFLYFIRLIQEYPQYSSDYWGWQYGYKRMHDIAVKKEKYFDDIIITNDFNVEEMLQKFYDVSKPCTKCRILTDAIIVTPERKQLFILKAEEIEEVRKSYPNFNFIQENSISLPDGKPEFFIGQFRSM